MYGIQNLLNNKYNLSPVSQPSTFVFYKFFGDLEFFRGVKFYLSHSYSLYPFI